MLLAQLASATAPAADAAGSHLELSMRTMYPTHRATPRADIADRDIMRDIHFSQRIRRGQLSKLPDEPHMDMRPVRTWGLAAQKLQKNDAQIYEDLPRFIRSASQCPFPVTGSAIEMTEEFWAFGDSIKVSKVDAYLPRSGHTQLGRVSTSFWHWGSHWMRIEREWRDPSGESVIASSRGGAQSWYHNTVDIYDCEGEMLSYLKFKLGENGDQDYTRITVHDLVGNEVAVAFTPRDGEDGTDWRHRRIVVHDRNSGMKMAELNQLDTGEDWRITFHKGSEILGGLGSDPRVLVMLVASRDLASQFGLASVPLWAFVVAFVILLLFCIWCNLANIQRVYSYKKITDTAGQQLPQIGADDHSWLSEVHSWGRSKKKLDEVQPDGEVPTFESQYAGWFTRGGRTQQGGDASANQSAWESHSRGSGIQRAN